MSLSETTSQRVSSYDPNAKVPKRGSRWVWEIDKPHACAIVEVMESFWNGEEWWVRTKALLPNLTFPGDGGEHLNDLSRFMEACTPIGGTSRALLEYQTIIRKDVNPSNEDSDA